MWMVRHRLAGFGTVGVLALVACNASDPGGLRAAPDAGGDGDGEERDASEPELLRLAGEVEGTDVAVGAVVDRLRQARIFFCGGPTSYETATRWVTAEIDRDGSYAYEGDGWRVRGTIETDRLTGTLERTGEQSRAFRAEAAREGTLAGLYEGEADCGRLGLIVLQPTAAAEAEGQGACVGAGHLPEQVNPILPISLEGGEIRVQVGGAEARVREAAPPPG